MSIEARAKFWKNAFSASNSLGIFCQCFVAFATYSTQHDDQVDVISWLALAYFAGSSFFAWAEWKENINYDGAKFVENYTGKSLANGDTNRLLDDGRLQTNGGTFDGRRADRGGSGSTTPLSDVEDGVFVSSVFPKVEEDTTALPPRPPTPSEKFTMFKVAAKDFLEVSFIYFEMKRRIMNRVHDEDRLIAKLNLGVDWILPVYWLLSMPFKYHSKILNSGLDEKNLYKTGYKLSAFSFWFGVVGHSLEHYLPLLLTVAPPALVDEIPKLPLLGGLVAISTILMTSEALFTRAFDGEECLKRSAGDANRWRLSDCFVPLLRYTWWYKPLARVSDDVLAGMSLLRATSSLSLMPKIFIGVAVSFPAAAGAYYVDVLEARKHLGMS